MKVKASVIITTYNWPTALKMVIDSLNFQTESQFEIIIADDGSREDTKQMVLDITAKSKVKIKHVWQEDKGFRAARCRNLAVKEASADYIIFLDGDCMVPPNFIANHLKLQEPGYFIPGNRVLLQENFTKQVLDKNIKVFKWSKLQWLQAMLQKKCNRISPLFNLCLLRKLFPKQWKGAKGCNLAMWKQDLLAVNGWNEKFTGWGFEDSELIIRLIKHGIKRKSGKFNVPVIHLWHKENDRRNVKDNWKMLMDMQK